MGVTLPELPPASSDNNVTFGDKDSIRRRALWALEGKSSVSFGQVEIPVLSAPDDDKPVFDFASKSGLPGGTSVPFGSTLMGSKRDSFKLLPPSGSSKDALHTLVEEEEEEEEAPAPCNDSQDLPPSPVSVEEAPSAPEPTPASDTVATTEPPDGKPRSTNLTLRPLSLVAETLAATSPPTSAVSPTSKTPLRSLALSPTSSAEETAKEIKQSRRSSFNFLANRRPSLNIRTSSEDSTNSSGDENKPPRRSSISYKTSGHFHMNSAGLPTPEMTPTFRRLSLSEPGNPVEEEPFLGPRGQASCKPLSASEQHFLLKSHNALVARITDLERALSNRMSMSSDSRPGSLISDATSSEISSVPDEPSDEMLRFIRDLKAERDELKKDVDGWRTRVADLDRKQALLAQRVEAERWEAWAARSRVGVLEAEKAALEQRLEVLDENLAQFDTEKGRLVAENRVLKEQNEDKARRIVELEAELARVQEELEQERLSHEREVAALKSTSADPLATPTPDNFAVQSTMSPQHHFGFALESQDQPFGFNCVSAPEDDTVHLSEDTGLAGYDGASEGDECFQSASSSSKSHFGKSAGSDSDSTDESLSESSRPVIPPRPTEPLRDSLSFNWTFPRAQQRRPAQQDHGKQQSVDRFFNCMDESDASDDSAPASPASFNYEQSKDMFASGFRFSADEENPFFLPPGVGTVVEDDVEMKNERVLTSVAEVEEDDSLEEDFSDDNMFVNNSGIMITFTPAEEVAEVKVPQIQVTPPKDVSAAPVLPAFSFDFADEDEDASFMFGMNTSPSSAAASVEPSTPAQRVASPPTPASPPPSTPVSPPPSSLPRPSPPKASSPSSIPRAVSRRNNSRSTDRVSIRSPSPRSSTGSAPAARAVGGSPSFIPQRVASPPTPGRVAPLSFGALNNSTSSFIKPPHYKSPTAKKSESRSSNGSPFTQPATHFPGRARKL